MKTKLAALLVLTAVALLTGCASWEKNLPLVNAAHFEYHRAGGVGATDIVAENLTVTPDQVAADTIEASTTLPFVGGVRVSIKGYRRDRNTASP